MNTPQKGLCASLILLALTGSAFASEPASTGKVYVGIFGGGGTTNDFNVSQYGTAFYTEDVGGPLAVNAFGHTNSPSVWLFGAQVGYQAPNIMLDPRTHWMLAPAIELEGYTFNNKTFNGDLSNNTARLPEHDFLVSYPMRRNIFLTNFIFNFNNPCYLLHPYVGFGFGGALVGISGADATQIDPPEEGINHYNGNASDKDTTFAGQFKVGLSYDINKCFSLFLEYRWLYVGSTHFAFGSTVYDGHPETSGWNVQMDPQRSNLGTIGIKYNMQ
jgi:hypothetical protein